MKEQYYETKVYCYRLLYSDLNELHKFESIFNLETKRVDSCDCAGMMIRDENFKSYQVYRCEKSH